MGLSTVGTFKNLPKQDNLISVEGSLLKSLQGVLLGMLSDISAICDECKIDYFLGGGTCLGAMRHHGFIPWDDDVDLNITREDFQSLRTELERRFPGKYEIQTPENTPDYGLCFPRIRLNGTILRSREDFQDNESHGVYIDIFYIESIPDMTVARGLHGAISMFLGLAYSCRRFAAHASDYMKLADGNPEIVSTFKKKIWLGRVFSFRSVDAWTKAWNGWNGRVRNDTSRYISIPVGRKHYFGETYLRSSFFPARRVPFEGLTLCVPNRVEEYLTNLYGDYMQIPPEEDRETHVVYEIDLGNACGVGA